MWLLATDVYEAYEHAKSRGATDAQQQAFDARLRARASSSALPVKTGVVTLRVEGILTKHPDLIAMILGYGNTTYTSLRRALEQAEDDPDIAEVHVFVDSPGGNIDGLFELLGAFHRFSKPMRVHAENALSAAYAIAAVAGPIEASSQGARFGSLGAASSFLVDTENAPVRRVDLTNTESPDKRPDVRTEDGKAVVRRTLDAAYELLVEHVAKGRGVAESLVVQEFGRGTTFLADEARRRGMIDAVAVQAATTSKVPKAETDDAFASHFSNTVFLWEQVGVMRERMRCSAHLQLAEASGDFGLATNAIRDGADVTATLRAAHCASALSRTTNREQLEALSTEVFETKAVQLEDGYEALRQARPDLYEAAVARGRNQERARVRDHTEGIVADGRVLSTAPVAIEAIRSGEAVAGLRSSYAVARMLHSAPQQRPS